MPAAAPSWYDGGQLVFASVASLLAIGLVNPTAADAQAIAEFSPAALPKDWIANSDPFHRANKEELGYQVIIQVIPHPVIAESTDATAAWLLPPPACKRLPGN